MMRHFSPPCASHAHRLFQSLALNWNSGHKLWVFWQNIRTGHKVLLEIISTWNAVKCKSRRRRRTEGERVENKWFWECWYEHVEVLNSSWCVCFLFRSPYWESGSRPFTHAGRLAQIQTAHSLHTQHLAFIRHIVRKVGVVHVFQVRFTICI